MRLLLDAGNSRLKWGQHDGREWLAQGVLAYDQLHLLASLGEPAEAVIGSNVAGAAIAGRITAALGRSPDWNTACVEQCGVRSSYDEPQRLGADRWAALVGARHLHGGAALVVMAGTATTVDTLDEDGLFLGGVILPGIELMRRALAGGTAQLPLAAGHYRDYPRTTEDAIQSGCCEAQAGAIERLFRRLAARPRPLCLLSGGAADELAGLLGMPLWRVDNLVLEGLARIAADRANICG